MKSVHGIYSISQYQEKQNSLDKNKNVQAESRMPKRNAQIQNFTKCKSIKNRMLSGKRVGTPVLQQTTLCIRSKCSWITDEYLGKPYNSNKQQSFRESFAVKHKVYKFFDTIGNRIIKRNFPYRPNNLNYCKKSKKSSNKDQGKFG